MIDILQAISKSFVIKAIFIIIIISFLLTSTGNYLTNSSNDYVAKVNNTVINQLQLQRAIWQTTQILQKQLGNNFTKIINNEQGNQILHRQAIENLIVITLFDQYFKELGLITIDDQIKQNIFNMPIFQTNGIFDTKKYRAVLSKNNINANDFASEIRQNLINYQLNKIYVTNEFILPEEVKNYASLILQQREIKVATLLLSKYQSKEVVSHKELQDYYNNHYNNFISPEQVQVSFIKLDALSQQKSVSVSNKELKDFYRKNIANFIQPAQKHYSMIKIQTEQEAKYAIKALAKGVSFKELASKRFMNRFTKINYSVLGWIDDTSAPNEIIIANLTKKGEISQAMKLATNYVIFQLNDIRPKTVKSFQTVKTKIANILINEKAINRFHALQKIASTAAINNNESLTPVEQATGIKAVKTSWFSRDNLPKEINFNKVNDAIFNSNLINKNGSIAGINLDLVNVNNNCAFIIRIEGYKPQSIKSFDNVKKIIVKLIKSKKALKKMEEDGNKLFTRLKYSDGNKDDAVLSRLNINFGKTQVVRRFSKTNPLAELVFRMPTPKGNLPSYSYSKDNKNNLIFIKLIKVIYIEPTKKELEFFSPYYKTIFGNMMMESLISNLRNKSKIDLGHI